MSIEDNQHRKKNNYKLLVDPELQKGKKKLYRLNGAIPGKQPIPDPKDPRVVKTVLGAAGKDLELPIPRFKYDRYWIESIPQRDVTVVGLSETLSLNTTQLKELCESVGPVHSIRSHKNPVTRSYNGLASVSFVKAGDGLAAVDKIGGTVLNGCKLQVVLDDKGDYLRSLMSNSNDIRRASVDSIKSQEVTTPTPRLDMGGAFFPSDTSEDQPSKSNRQTYRTLLSSSGDSPLGGGASSLDTPDSGISLKPNFDPLLSLRLLSMAAKRNEALPPLPSSAPPDEHAPPPPPVKEGIENISSDDEKKSPSTKEVIPLEYEEISGDESPVMVYSQLLEVEEISSDEGHNSDMELDEDLSHENVIEVNVPPSGINKPYYEAPPIPPPIPPSFPPPPNFFLPTDYYKSYSSYSSQLNTVPTQNGYPHDSKEPDGHTQETLDEKFPKQWDVPSAAERLEKLGQNVLYYALEQLSKILVSDIEKKLVQTAAFPVLDQFLDKKTLTDKQKMVNGNEGGDGETTTKPLEPYRRMLPGLIPESSRDNHDGEVVVTTPRKRLMNFKIPLTNRGGQRRDAVMAAQRRLYKDDTDKDRDRRRKRSKRTRHRRDDSLEPSTKRSHHNISHLSVLSDISSDELFNDTDATSVNDKKGKSGPHTPSDTSEGEEEGQPTEDSQEDDEKERESEGSQFNDIFGSSSSSSDFEEDMARIKRLKSKPTADSKKKSIPRNKTILEAAPTLPLPPTPPPIEDKPKVEEYRKRTIKQEEMIIKSIMDHGPDAEDVSLMKLALSRLKSQEVELVMDVPWSHYPSHIITSPPASFKRGGRSLEEELHPSGCARTEGYYKINPSNKSKYLPHLRRNKANVPTLEQKQASSGRGNRLNHRRVASLFTSGDISKELQQYNQLKARKKQLRFAKSTIHNWGLFALEYIPADEMVVEYIGQVIRIGVADERERRYEAQGIGSSYLFRVDLENVIDATKSGNYARFINHCCDPNCYAKIIGIGNQKKIVIYSKRDIQSGEEITYDYKFPIEDEKIPCLCGAPQCRGTLN